MDDHHLSHIKKLLKKTVCFVHNMTKLKPTSINQPASGESGDCFIWVQSFGKHTNHVLIVSTSTRGVNHALLYWQKLQSNAGGLLNSHLNMWLCVHQCSKVETMSQMYFQMRRSGGLWMMQSPLTGGQPVDRSPVLTPSSLHSYRGSTF